MIKAKISTVAFAVAPLLVGAVVAHAEEALRRVVFQCEQGRYIAVRFAGESAALEAGVHPVALSQQRTASGVHYVGGGHDLRGKGVELTWTDPHGVVMRCREQGSVRPAAQYAVKNAAAAASASAAVAGGSAGSADAFALAGTSWRLLRFQSTDDAVGVVVPPRVERYELTFAPDGALTARLDCNRAAARWEASDAGAGAAGGLTVRPGPMTRASCGEEAMDGRLVADFARIRSYAVRDGLLTVALEADAGVYVWEPVAASTQENAAAPENFGDK